MITQPVYDAAGRSSATHVYTTPISLTAADLTPSGDYLETKFGYDENGNRIWTVDAKNRQTDFEYDVSNRRTFTRFPLVTGEAGQQSTLSVYDGLGRHIQERDAAGVLTAFGYDVLGRLVSVTNDYKLTYDQGETPVVTTYSYDEFGNKITQTDANGHTTKFEYDALGRRTRRILPDGSFEKVSYSTVPDSQDMSISLQKITTTDFRSATISVTQDRMGRISIKALPVINSALNEQGTVVTYSYQDQSGLLDHVTMSGDVNRTTYFAYDDSRRLRKKDTPEGVITYTYTSDDHVETIKGYRRSVVIPANQELPTGATADVSIGYSYDSFGRLSSVTNNDISSSAVTSYGYDEVGNLDHFVYPNNVTHQYNYDERNRLKSLGLTRSDNSILRSYTYSVDVIGARTGVMEEGVSGTLRSVGYEYDRDYFAGSALARVHRLTKENLFDSGNTASGTIVHAYDQVGNRTGRTVSGFTFTPTTILSDQSLTFDARDQIDNDSDPLNSNDRYDQDGNTVKDVTGNSTDDLYDAENHLIAHGSNVRLGYDESGNRVSKTVNDVTTFYLVDDKNPSGYSQVLAEFTDTTAGPTRVYEWGLQLISETQTINSQQTTSYYGFDGQGSIRILISAGAQPNITDTYDYDVYGILIAQTPQTWATPNRYLYTGQQWDDDLALYMLRTRNYSPDLGRFMTPDSFEGSASNPEGLNKYLYCNANPVMYSDPSGRDGIDIAFNFGSLGLGGPVGAIVARYVRQGTLTADDSKFQLPDLRSPYISDNVHSIVIQNSRATVDDIFKRLAELRVLGATAEGGPVSGVGQRIHWRITGEDPLTAVKAFFGQQSFYVQCVRFVNNPGQKGPDDHCFVVATMGGHPLRGWRFWRVFENSSGGIVVQTGAVDEPNGPINRIKARAGGNDAILRLWYTQLWDIRVNLGKGWVNDEDDNMHGKFNVGNIDDLMSIINGKP